MNDIVDANSRVLERLVGLLGRGVGARVCATGESAPCHEAGEGGHLRQLTNADGALCDHGAIGLIHDTVHFLEVVRVRDDLVASGNILVEAGSIRRFVAGAPRWTGTNLENNHLGCGTRICSGISVVQIGN